MFQYLPHELIVLIYEYDTTYREIFNKCMKQINKFWIYKCRGVSTIYYIYNPEKLILHVTDNLKKPSYICTSFGVSKTELQTIKNTHHLRRGFNYSLEYDIEEYLFYENFI